MREAELAGLVFLVLLLLAIALVVLRRWLFTRSGGVDICWRTLAPTGSTWTFGQGRYSDASLSLFRSFSPLPIASLVLPRDQVELGMRRSADTGEHDLLPVGAVIVRCMTGPVTPRDLELAMSEEVLTGFRSWLESVPPGSMGVGGSNPGRTGQR